MGGGCKDSQVPDLEGWAGDGGVVYEGGGHRRGRFRGKDQEFGDKMSLSQIPRTEYQISERR